MGGDQGRGKETEPTEGRNGSHTGGSRWVVEGGATAASPARSSVRTSNSPAGMSFRALQMHTTGLCLEQPSGKCVSSLGGPLSINHSHTAEGGGIRIGRMGRACCTECRRAGVGEGGTDQRCPWSPLQPSGRLVDDRTSPIPMPTCGPWPPGCVGTHRADSSAPYDKLSRR